MMVDSIVEWNGARACNIWSTTAIELPVRAGWALFHRI